MLKTPGTRFTLEVTPRIPPKLARLAEIADDLWYAWDRPARNLYARLDPALWQAVGHSPKALLRQVDEKRLHAAADDPGYLSSYKRVLSAYDSYLDHPRRIGDGLGPHDLVAYFCAEFGFHESLPIYSGGLGILAGDHCKAASDNGLPFVGVGLLYRQGFFTQTIDGEGSQQATYVDSDFDALPIGPAYGADGRPIQIRVELPGRDIAVRVWQARVGLVRLYLLDTDLPGNSDGDRDIAHRLYGGGQITRLEQEIVLGIGGVRALTALGLAPTVWHINEGHAAFQILERTRMLTQSGVDFAAAFEAVAASTVFTTHTAVPAGHDHFPDDLMRRYFNDCCRESHIDPGVLLALGHTPRSNEFNMTALALRGSRYHNGVSRIHRGVSADMLRDLWPQIEPAENPISHVTNGVHVMTFLAPEWHDIFDRFLGADWMQRVTDTRFWERIERIPDPMFWSVREYLKSQMLRSVRFRVHAQLTRNRGSESHLERLFRFADPSKPNVLTVGFARRFATYKRATLLFRDLDALHRLVSNPEHPILFIFAGKAHPDDTPGQDLIREIMRIAKLPEFVGHFLLVEDYDLRLARRLVSGVDVWLNNPIHPLEASGTSGMKAAMNGAVNLSVLDGWWEEAYDGTNGWGIKPASDRFDQVARDRDEARTLHEILQEQLVPLYYAREGNPYSLGWIRMAKRAMATVIPRFNADRMLLEYVKGFYSPASRHGRILAAEDHAAARDVARWKERVRGAWPGVSLRRLDKSAPRIIYGEAVRFEAALRLNGLSASDVIVEVVIERLRGVTNGRQQHIRLTPDGTFELDGAARYVLDLTPDLCGRLELRLRAYPHHPQLAHPFETGLMLWA